MPWPECHRPHEFAGVDRSDLVGEFIALAIFVVMRDSEKQESNIWTSITRKIAWILESWEF